MQIETISIMYLGMAFLFAVLICVALPTIVEQTTSLLVGKKKDPLNQLRTELDAVKIEVKALKTKLEVTTYSTKMTEQAHFAPVSPATSQLVPEDTWSRGNSESQPIQGDTLSRVNGEGQSIQEDTWSRVELVCDTSIVPPISQSNPGDTWTRDAGKSESVNSALLGFPTNGGALARTRRPGAEGGAALKGCQREGESIKSRFPLLPQKQTLVCTTLRSALGQKHFAVQSPCPLYPQKRTCAVHQTMSALCQ